MNKKLFMSLVPLLAIAAFAVMPMVAQAETGPHWFSNEELIKEGQVVKVATRGELTFKHFVVDEFEVNCKLTDTETIENPVGGGAGVDTITSLKFSHCVYGHAPGGLPGSPIGICKVKAESLPWHTRLIAGPPVTDEIAGIDITVKCGPYHEVYTGTLDPLVGSSVLTFTSTTGELTNQTSPLSPVIGYDNLKGPKGDEHITGEVSRSRWYSNGKVILPGTKAQTYSWGTLTFNAPAFKNSPVGAVTCKKSDAGNIENPKGRNGTDETVLFDLYECKSLECAVSVTASGLPWPSELEQVSGVLRDKTTGIILTITVGPPCKEEKIVVTGEWTPKFVNGTAPKAAFEEFGAGSGELVSKEGRKKVEEYLAGKAEEECEADDPGHGPEFCASEYDSSGHTYGEVFAEQYYEAHKAELEEKEKEDNVTVTGKDYMAGFEEGDEIITVSSTKACKLCE